jgi:hypothetical protein
MTSVKVRFQSDFCSYFIVDLLMQHKFCCVNLIGINWRTQKTKQITPTNLRLTPPECNPHLDSCLDSTPQVQLQHRSPDSTPGRSVASNDWPGFQRSMCNQLSGNFKLQSPQVMRSCDSAFSPSIHPSPNND